MKVIALIAMVMLAAKLVAGMEPTLVSEDSAPSVLRTGNKVVLHSPSFTFDLGEFKR
jgi:hypothetical protein